LEAYTINQKLKKMITSKVKSVQGSGSFESQFGAEQPDGKKLLFSYEYQFEDGIVLSANHKTVPAPFKKGDTVEYEVTRESEQYGKSGKVSKPQDQSFQKGSEPSGDNLKGVKIGHAITNAVHIFCIDASNLNDTVFVSERIKELSRMILNLGKELNNESRLDIKQSKQGEAIEVIPAHPDTAVLGEDHDDLPF